MRSRVRAMVRIYAFAFSIPRVDVGEDFDENVDEDIGKEAGKDLVLTDSGRVADVLSRALR